MAVLLIKVSSGQVDVEDGVPCACGESKAVGFREKMLYGGNTCVCEPGLVSERQRKKSQKKSAAADLSLLMLCWLLYTHPGTRVLSTPLAYASPSFLHRAYTRRINAHVVYWFSLLTYPLFCYLLAHNSGETMSICRRHATCRYVVTTTFPHPN